MTSFARGTSFINFASLEVDGQSILDLFPLPVRTLYNYNMYLVFAIALDNLALHLQFVLVYYTYLLSCIFCRDIELLRKSNVYALYIICLLLFRMEIACF